jgi:anti-sigma-K factor RskA
MITPPQNPQLLDRLAAEYVLGTLRGGARRRLERWRASSAQLEARCRFWEERLLPLLGGVRPRRPPAHVWRTIQQRLQLTTPRASTWRPLTLAASVLVVLALGVLWYWQSTTALHPADAATISTPGGPVLWQVEVSARHGTLQRLVVQAGASAAPPAGHDYELWALPKGGKPVSLGVLPYGKALSEHALSEAQRQALGAAAQLAVSVEPRGGSPSGQPTGAVVFVVPLQRLS